MARANFVKKAQKAIYTHGKTVQYESKKGKRAGQTLSKHDRTVPADDKDPVLIAKGESYYWWQFKNGPKQFSKTSPKASQLTQSPYLSELYSIKEDLEVIGENCSDASDLEAARDEIVQRLEELRDTTQGSFDNMPDGLQQGDTGQLLEERVQNLETAIDELQSVDLDYDEPDEDDLREELKDDVDSNDLDEPEEGSEEHDDWDEDTARKEAVTDEMISEEKQRRLDEWMSEKIDELQSVSFE